MMFLSGGLLVASNLRCWTNGTGTVTVCVSVLRHRFVQIKDRIGNQRECCHCGKVKFWIVRLFADLQEILCRVWTVFKVNLEAGKIVLKDLDFVVAGLPTGDGTKCPLDPIAVRGQMLSLEDPFREEAGGFDKRHIV